VTHQLNPNQESKLFWQTWLESNPTNKREYIEAAKIIGTIQMGLKTYESNNISVEAKNYIFREFRKQIRKKLL